MAKSLSLTAGNQKIALDFYENTGKTPERHIVEYAEWLEDLATWDARYAKNKDKCLIAKIRAMRSKVKKYEVGDDEWCDWLTDLLFDLGVKEDKVKKRPTMQNIETPREFVERLPWMSIDGKPDFDQWENHLRCRDAAIRADSHGPQRGGGIRQGGDEMTERPILFSGEMVRAILEGRKTMTRRVIKPQPHGINGKTASIDLYKDGPYFIANESDGFPSGEPLWKCHYGQPGDRLWVRETWTPDCDEIIFRADLDVKDANSIKWRPSIFMPRHASRILLEVVSVRVEMVNQISNGDILREGIRSESCNICVHEGGSGCEHCFSILTPFRDLWDSINAKRGYGWDANPLVWVVEFKKVEATR